jgi:hypothetical protein
LVGGSAAARSPSAGVVVGGGGVGWSEARGIRADERLRKTKSTEKTEG